MSALDELTNKNNWKTEETFGKYGAVHVDVFTGIVDISDAAEELAALRERVGQLERIAKAAKAVSGNLSKTEIIDIDGKDYNVWSIVGDAEKDELAAALRGEV